MKKKLLWAAAGAGAVFAARVALRQRREMDFTGKTVLITGGSRGLGLLLAREFAAAGARIAICARDEEELERARQDLEERGAQVLALPCDVTSREQVEAMIQRVVERFDQIDVLVNNAGVIQSGPLELMTLEDYEEAMQTHFWAPLYAIMAALPAMRERHSGRIVNISSFGGKVSVPHLVPYSASKFALTGLSGGLRAELAKDGIFVTTVCPGLMRTGSHVNVFIKGRRQAEYALFSIMSALPLSSMDGERAARQVVTACRYGDPETVLSKRAQLAVMLASLFPGLAADVLSIGSRFLPGPDGPDSTGTGRARGKESFSALSPSWLTTLNDKAAERNNELG